MLMKKAINILGVPVTPFSMEEAVSFLMDRIAKKMPTQVVTANAEIIMMARNDKRYGTLLQQADLVLADGAGTVWAGRTLGYEVPERVAGFDLFVELIKKSAALGGNAVIGIDIDYNIFSNNVIGVIANGTSVVIRKI